MSDEPLNAKIKRLHPELLSVACGDRDQTIVVFGREYPGGRRCKLTEIRTAGKILSASELVPNHRFPEADSYEDYYALLATVRNHARLEVRPAEII